MYEPMSVNMKIDRLGLLSFLPSVSSILVHKRGTYIIQPNASSRSDISNRLKRDVMDGRDAVYCAATSLKALSIFANSTEFANLCKPGSDRRH